MVIYYIVNLFAIFTATLALAQDIFPPHHTETGSPVLCRTKGMF